MNTAGDVLELNLHNKMQIQADLPPDFSMELIERLILEKDPHGQIYRILDDAVKSIHIR